MPRNYNLQDPTDVEVLRYNFECIAAKDWQEYIEFAQNEDYWKAFSKGDRECLYNMQRNAGNTRRLSDKQIRWGVGLAEKIDEMKEAASKSEEAAKSLHKAEFKQPLRHVTFRVAWHDNKWNGAVCIDPTRNHYCSGFHSLLTERLRKRKSQNLQEEEANKGKPVSTYVPPCFWSINIFGSENLTIKHDNPAEKKLELITEVLPPRSIFSWPFAVSFTRDNDLYKIEGAYPKNLEEVRIPRFQSKIHKNKSVAFMYANYSNPFTEEDLQYLVVGCGLVTDNSEPKWFGPMSLIEEKRKSKAKLKNFPSMNWALRYSFEDENQLVRMPYHEYLEYVNKPGIDEEAKQTYFDKIKVAITEPELVHCFKYVAMDIDDDEAIYILSKMRQRLMECESDGIVPVAEMQRKIRTVEQLLEHCWYERSYFPGFESICRFLLSWDKQEFVLDGLIDDLQQSEGQDYANKFLELLTKPSADPAYKKYSATLRQVKASYEENYGLTTEEFCHLCLLNLNPFQFSRVLSGKLALSGDWRKSIADEAPSHELKEICKNPYLLFEEYESYEVLLDEVTGEEKDHPIELFKIDIAYFPDTRFGIERLDLQYQMKNNDRRRVRALLLQYLRTLENTGHCFADSAEIEKALKAYPLFYNMDSEYMLPAKFFDRLSSEDIIHFEENDKKLKVVSENDTNYFYLMEVYRAEEEIEEVVELLLQEPPNTDNLTNLDQYLIDSSLELRAKLKSHFEEAQFIEERKTLYTNIYNRKIFVLAGNPGSGKSFELLNIITDLQKKGEKCLILAPTGKAALRLKSDKRFSDIEAFTIDKFMADVRSGRVSRSSIHEFKNVVIDEMSMVDLLKLRDLLKLFNFRIPSFKRLILVGDPHQLPAIGYGKVLKDILYYLSTHPNYAVNFIELQTNCRQELAESRILEFSEGYVTDGDVPSDLKAKLLSGDTEISKGFRVHFWQSEGDLNKKIDEEFEFLCSQLKVYGDKLSKLNQLFELTAEGKIPKHGIFDLERFQILSPYRSDFFGTNKINDYFQFSYKQGLDLEMMDDRFKQSDKIIRTKNYYVKNQLKLSNGSVGVIRKDKTALLYFQELDEPMEIFGDDAMRSSEQEFFDLAYAITVHKAQGSGFNHTFFVLPKKPGLLSKELIYTALTRSRQSISLFIQGEADGVFDKSVLEKARTRSYTESRRTSLLLDKPFRYYALEADGYFIESRVELLIYQALKEKQKELGEPNFSFAYEAKPTVDGKELPMKTDFTVILKTGIWYWEHLGRIGNARYERTWHEVKKPTYQKSGAFESLITTHERNGINPDKIKEIINLITENKVGSEDLTNRYSKHHYSLR